jgi:hypothetical protein
LNNTATFVKQYVDKKFEAAGKGNVNLTSSNLFLEMKK